MSVLAAIALQDRIEIIADGSIYTPDGRLQMIAEKISILPEVPLAIVGRGLMLATDGAVGLLRSALDAIAVGGKPSFDTAARVMQETVFASMDQIGLGNGGPDKQSEYLIAGFDDDGNPLILGAGSYDAPGRDRWTLYALSNPVFSGPDVSAEWQRRASPPSRSVM